MSNEDLLQAAALYYSDNWEEVNGLDFDQQYLCDVSRMDFIAGARWQAEQLANPWHQDPPKENGSYICRMDTGSIKLRIYEKGQWYEPWSTNSLGTVVEWMHIPYNQTKKEDGRV
jgi:hypothetical protein